MNARRSNDKNHNETPSQNLGNKKPLATQQQQQQQQQQQ